MDYVISGRPNSQSQIRSRHWVLATVAALGCGDAGDPRVEVPAPPADSPGQLVFTAPRSEAGHLMRMDGRLAFLPCGEGPTATWVAESAGAGRAATEAWNELGGGNRPVPAMVRLAADTILEVRHAAPEGGACSNLPGDGLVSARGNEPFWHLRVFPDSAVVRTPELLDGVGYPGGKWGRPDATAWTYHVQDDSVTLVLREHRCRDGMSGAWFPFEAEVEWRGRTWRGCALEGLAAAPPRSQ